MPFTVGAEKVLLDSSAFFYFCDGGQVINLGRYLGTRAYVTLEVLDELLRNSSRYADLQTLERMRWPPEENHLELNTELKRELLDILRALRNPGDHDLQHAGEISTVLMAESLGGELVVLEDRDGKALAAQRGVPRLSTAMLAAEMVAVEYVSEDEGFGVYDAATPQGIGRPQWALALRRARRELSPPAN